MRIKKWLFITCLLIAGTATSQNRDVSGELRDIIRNFFYESNDPFTMEAIGKLKGPSEGVIVLLEIDSMGKVGGVHLMVEDSNKDSGYAILKKLKPTDFKDWKHEMYKSKTIVIPVVIENKSFTPKYIFHLADLTAISREVRGLVIGRTLVVGWPTIIREDPSQGYYEVNPK